MCTLDSTIYDAVTIYCGAVHGFKFETAKNYVYVLKIIDRYLGY